MKKKTKKILKWAIAIGVVIMIFYLTSSPDNLLNVSSGASVSHGGSGGMGGFVR